MTRFLKGAMILTLAGVIVKIIGAISKVLIARILGAEGIGLYQMAYPIYQIIVSLATAGLPVAISIMVAERLAKKDYGAVNKLFKIALSTLFALGVFFAVALFFLSHWFIARGIVVDSRAYYALVALAPSLLIVTVLSCFRGYFQGFQNMVPTGVSQIVEQSFRVVSMVGLALLLLPMGLAQAAAGATFATFPGISMALIVLIFFYRKQRKALGLAGQAAKTTESRGQILKRLFILAIPVSLANIMLPIVSAIDLFVVPKRLFEMGYSIESVTTMFGYLTGMATSLINLPIIVTTALAIGLVPAVSEAYALGNMDAVRARTHTALKIANLFTMPACIGLLVLATPVSTLLYATPKAGGPIAVMSLSIILLGWQQLTTGILQGLGRTVIPMINLIISAIVKVGLSWYLTGIPGLGINGAAWATNIDFALAAVLNMAFVYYYVGYRIHALEWGRILLSALIMGAAAYGVYGGIDGLHHNTVAVGLAIVIAFIVYLGALVAVRALKREDLYEMPGIGKRLRSRQEQNRIKRP